MKYWINTISRDHVMRGVAGGFTRANHGRPQGLKLLSAGDRMVFYSPKTEFENGEPLQMFTAIGTIKDDNLYQVERTPGTLVWQRDVEFENCHETPIRPLIDELSFIRDKTHWGYRFRLGLFEILAEDFELIERAMK